MADKKAAPAKPKADNSAAKKIAKLEGQVQELAKAINYVFNEDQAAAAAVEAGAGDE